MAAATCRTLARLESTNRSVVSSAPNPTRQSLHFPSPGKQQVHHKLSSLSMNGCQLAEAGAAIDPVGTVETRTLLPVPTPSDAVESLVSAVSELRLSGPPPFSSGIIRLQVPIQQQIKAIDWLHAHHEILPRLFFSGRRQKPDPDFFLNYSSKNGSGNGYSKFSSGSGDLVSVAGVGATVYFRRSHSFSFNDWRSIKRFLSKKCPMVRAYGAIRFDAKAEISEDWEQFGSFYFMVPKT